ncbi:MAG: BACON domain-containing protein [Tannerella sp.]|nr:BACON domain-containing protein [Tannerella sp.]
MDRFLKYSMTGILLCLAVACEEKYERTVLPVEISGELTQDVPAEGGTYYLTLTYEGEVTLKSAEPWCTAEYLGSASANNIKITVAPNAGTADDPFPKKRSAGVSILTFSNPTINVQMNQEGLTAPVLEKPKVAANWQFKNSAAFGKAATGADLELKGSGFFEAEGIGGSTAVEVAKGSHFLARHGIAANGGGTKVNNYSILIDFKLPNDNRYCFYQTNLANSDDVDFFLRSNMYQLGIGSVYTDLQADPIKSGVWYRLVVSAQLGESLKYYLNGREIYSSGGGGDAARDSRLALDPDGVLLFADEDGEDESIYVAQVTIWDQPLDAADVAALGDAGSNDYLTFAGPLTGRWLFDDPEHPGAAEQGNDLMPAGSAIWEADGPDADNKAVSVGKGSYFLAKHGIAPGGTTAAGDPAAKVNEYTLLIDFKVAETGRYYAFMQTDLTNGNDGEIFINGDGKIGISGGYYSEAVVQPETWYRWVVTVKCGELWKQYLDGALLHEAAADHDGKMNVDDRFALDPSGVLLFADEDGEDNEIFVAAAAIWNKALSAEEVAALGQVGAPIQ